MGDLIQFRPRPRDAVEIVNVQIIGSIPAGARLVAPADAAMSGAAQSISGNGATVFYEVERVQVVDTAKPLESLLFNPADPDKGGSSSTRRRLNTADRKAND